MTPFSMLAAAVLAGTLMTSAASADVQAFVGSWRHTVISEDDRSKLSCRTLTVTVRRYMLQHAPNRSLVFGQYSLATHRIWLGPTTGCESPSTLANMGQRADWWAVRGSAEDDGRLSIVAEHDRCYGGCAGEAAVKAFSTELSLRRGSLVDVIEETNQRLYFLEDEVASDFELEASQHLFPLLRPLHEGNCIAFLEDSMDPQVSSSFSRTEFCMSAQRIAKLLGDVIANEPIQSIHFNRATLFNHADQRRWSINGGGDVLVEYLIKLDGQGNGVLSSAIMRRQPDGGWKVLHFMP